VELQGTLVSNPDCLRPNNFEFRVSSDTLTLNGYISHLSGSVDHMIMHRMPGQSCFHGHWRSSGLDYVAHLDTAFLRSSVLQTTGVNAGYSEASCDEVRGTTNVHWRLLSGAGAPCWAIELTRAMNVDRGRVRMRGESSTDAECSGMSGYHLNVSSDGLTMTGYMVDLTAPQPAKIQVLFSRYQHQQCFHGHWSTAGYDYIGHIDSSFLRSQDLQTSAEVAGFSAEACRELEGTTNIHWRLLSGPLPACAAVEYTAGSVVSMSSLVLNGTGTSNPLCAGTGNYSFGISGDGLRMTGYATDHTPAVTRNILMTLERAPGEACFHGHWTSSQYNYLAHINSEFLGSSAFQTAASSSFNAEACNYIAGTTNIHWRMVAGHGAPCTTIEFTRGGTVSKTSLIIEGYKVSNPRCAGTDSYNLKVSDDGSLLSGYATTYHGDDSDSMYMAMVRMPGEACFVGRWTNEDYDFVGHISASYMDSKGGSSSARSGLHVVVWLLLVLFVGGAVFAAWTAGRPSQLGISPAASDGEQGGFGACADAAVLRRTCLAEDIEETMARRNSAGEAELQGLLNHEGTGDLPSLNAL